MGGRRRTGGADRSRFRGRHGGPLRPDDPSGSPLTIVTDRLRLSRLTYEDGPFLLRLLNDPSFVTNIGDRGVRTLGDTRRYLDDGPFATYARHGFGLLRVTLGASGEAIGICGLLKRDHLPDPDIGYALLPDFAGLGYATEAAAAVLAHARGTLGLARILAIVSPGNTASIRVLEKLGFIFDRETSFAPASRPIKLFVSANLP